MLQSVDKAVKLILNTEKNTKEGTQKTEVYQKSYTLQQLNDLQSKLMLVAGKASKGKEDVEKFVEVLIFSYAGR